MKSNLLIYIVVIAAVSVSAWALFNKTPSSGLTSPFAVAQSTSSPTPTPLPTPIQYNFDKSSDLKGELNSINPEIKDSDFNDIKSLGEQF